MRTPLLPARFATAGALLLVAVALATSGCARTVALEPASKALLIDKATVRQQQAGVALTARLDGWTDHPGVLDHTTPLWLTIDNHSERPLEVRLDHLAIIAPDGTRLIAMAAEDVTGDVTVRVEPERTFEPVSYDSYEPGAPVADGALIDPADGFYDPYAAHRGYRANVPLPTEQMRRDALRETTLAPGESVSGYVYFPHIDEEDYERQMRRVGLGSLEPTVSLELRLVDPVEQRNFGLISIPFVVD